MRWAFILLLFTLSACAKKNLFVLEDPKGTVQSAMLQICGSAVPLERTGKVLKLAHPITCEGDGKIRVLFRDGGVQNCVIGYVNSGAKQKWLFEADEQFGCLQEKE